MFTITLSDGTPVTVDGTLDPSLPIVVLLHGLGGTSMDMTAPLSAYPGVVFDRTVGFPAYRDEGFHISPPLVPVARFFLDPLATALTSWNAALKAAGFTTVTYTQKAPSGPIATNVTQLALLVTQALIGDPRLMGLRVAFVGHSRGGLIARSFLAGARVIPALAAFLPRVTSLIALHSPNAGSGLAGIATTVDALLARLQTAFTAAGLIAPGILATMRAFTGNPALAELAPGSATLAAIAAGEPVPGIMYHTFGGTSTNAARLWAGVYTPDSTIPIPVPFPLFHWGSTPVVVGTLLNVVSFVPAAILVQLPIVIEILTVLTALAASTPEVAPGAGDLLVSDARARLPFSTSHAANPLNHVEALSDRTLQAQVVAILTRLRSPLVSGVATARLSPYPARRTSTQYTVTAVDAVTGATISSGTVTVRDTYGNVALTAPLGGHFPYTFASRRVSSLDPETHRRVSETVWPTVNVQLGPPYGSVEVDTGLA
jgi:pimeloyl-ACP methyl ester carboxylesterase